MIFSGTAEDILNTFKTVANVAKEAQGNPEGLIESIEIHTRWLPPILIDKPLVESNGVPSPADAFAKAFKPKVIVRVKGIPSIEYAPAGEPGPTRWPYVRAGLVVGGIGFAYLIFRMLRK
ncbi:MAG: hypothetical protein WC729_29265 [Sphingomonas sp.]|jgi:hypothetical protein|uniref:hypothetical protein n=1 Tax=Sphingomonas sp. TaxID=28214 RepID=UPI00356ACC37